MLSSIRCGRVSFQIICIGFVIYTLLVSYISLTSLSFPSEDVQRSSTSPSSSSPSPPLVQLLYPSSSSLIVHNSRTDSRTVKPTHRKDHDTSKIKIDYTPNDDGSFDDWTQEPFLDELVDHLYEIFVATPARSVELNQKLGNYGVEEISKVLAKIIVDKMRGSLLGKIKELERKGSTTEEATMNLLVGRTQNEKIVQSKCNEIQRNLDPAYQLERTAVWSELTDGDVNKIRSRFRKAVKKLNNQPPAEFQFDGRGIVTHLPDFNRLTVSRLRTLLRLLEHHNCTLKVEVWYFMDSPGAQQLEVLKKEERIILREFMEEEEEENKNKNKQKQKQKKQKKQKKKKEEEEEEEEFFSHSIIDRENSNGVVTAAILSSGFQEVLWLDVNNIPLSNLDSLFERPAYLHSGVVFWPSIWKTARNDPMWRLLDIPCVDEWEQDTGQILVDKKRHWKALHLAYLVSKDFLPALNDSDLNSFRVAFKALGVEVAWPIRYLGLAGNEWFQFCGHTFAQPDIPTKEELEDLEPGLWRSKVLSDLLEVDEEFPRYLFLHAHHLPEVPTKVIGKNVWTLFSRYRIDSSNPNLAPDLLTTVEGLPCVYLRPPVFRVPEQDPLYHQLSGIEVIPFDQAFPGFLALYNSLEGPGGGDDSSVQIGDGVPIPLSFVALKYDL